MASSLHDIGKCRIPQAIWGYEPDALLRCGYPDDFYKSLSIQYVGTGEAATALVNGQVDAVVIDPNFGLTAAQSALESIGVTTSFAMVTLLIAFIWNIILVFFRKYTKVRTLFTTGHIMVKQSTVATWIIFFLIPELRNMGGIVLVGLLCGTYWSVFSNLTVEATQELTEGSGFAIGHQQMLGVWFAYRFGKFFKGKKKEGEESKKEIKLGGAMKVLDDYVVSTTLIMLLFFGTIMVILGPDLLRELDKSNFSAGLTFPVYIFQRCASFAVSLVVLKTGIRMFVGEMVESFEGISGSILKGSLPAVDCAATYSFGDSNAVTLGFLFGAVGQLIQSSGCLLRRLRTSAGAGQRLRHRPLPDGQLRRLCRQP